MTASQIIEEMNSKDIFLTLDGGFLRYEAPDGIMTPNILSTLKDQKASIIAELQARLRIPLRVPKTTVQKMTKCLHGKPCRFIYLSDDRQICSKNNQPIFDMTVCPDGKWERFKNKPQKKTRRWLKTRLNTHNEDYNK
ncbi:MAG: hypothetical protein KAI50_11615 [Desulfobacterales bacterium]|nr:hypothetical protein [Desulfobacterales bacterium]